MKIQWILILVAVTIISCILIFLYSPSYLSSQPDEGDWGISAAFYTVIALGITPMIVAAIARERKILHAAITFFLLVSIISFITFNLELIS